MSVYCLMHRPRRLLVERLEQRLPMCAVPVAMQAPVEMPAYEQEMLELINRARANPSAEAARLGISLNEGLPAGTLGTEARQPLAPSGLLNHVATGHSNDMIQRAYFGHNNPEGEGPVDRAIDAGYNTTFVGENLSAKAPLTLPAAAQTLHNNLFLSSSHRVNTLLGEYREIGLGLRHGSIKFTNGQVQVGSLVTQLFGGGTSNQIFVTGVAYEETTGNNTYNVGEGRGGIIVEARDAQGHRFATTTGSSGGYSLRLDSGSYRIFAYTANRTRMLDLGTVNLTRANVKIDVHSEDLAGGRIVSETIVIAGGGQTWSMSDPTVNLVDVCRIDMRGTGNNLLQVDVASLRESWNAHVLMVVGDPGDSIEFDAGWQLDSMRVDDGSLIRRFRNGATQIDLVGPNDLTNPIDPFDVNASDSVTSADALAIVNELAARRFSVPGSGATRSVTSFELGELKLFDVSADGRVTSLDALLVINEMGRRSNQELASAEQLIVPSLTIAINLGSSGEDQTRHPRLAIESEADPPDSTASDLDWEHAWDNQRRVDAVHSVERTSSYAGRKLPISAQLADQSITAWLGDTLPFDS